MTTPIFPYVLSTGDEQDSANFTVEHEDPSIRSDMEGGYVYSRPRFTRTPRRTWTSGFTYIKPQGKSDLEAFWQTVKGGSDLFQWRNPSDGTDIIVRFKGPLKFTYRGNGSNKRWDVQFTVEEV
jgi:phage-related protein